MNSNVKLPPNQYTENITKMFNTLYKEEHLTDVTLCCKDGSLRAHKVVLATCSPYFHKIFIENNQNNLVVVMHGVNFQNLNNLIELIYKGNVQVAPEHLNFLYELADEFQIAGIRGLNNTLTKESNSNVNQKNTRGQKRLSVDSDDEENPKRNKLPIVLLSQTNKTTATTQPSLPPPPLPQTTETSFNNIKNEQQDDDAETSEGGGGSDGGHGSENRNCDNKESPPKLSAWAKKQRKFKCLLCPSSFKRSSHLTRHQLVHTGERPYACNQCDKAFSRHDKLKHHIRKTHEINTEPIIAEADCEIKLRNIAPKPLSPLPFIISQVESVEPVELVEAMTSTESPSNVPTKRGRGRPRKYPIATVTKPTIKRGRGRPPRINSSSTSLSQSENHNGENYDITNLPFGDLEYLTMPIIPQRAREPDESMIIEPFVEIKTEKDNGEDDKNKSEDEDDDENLKDREGKSPNRPDDDKERDKQPQKKDNTKEKEQQMQQLQLQMVQSERGRVMDEAVCDRIINKITKIGECTISVANY